MHRHKLLDITLTRFIAGVSSPVRRAMTFPFEFHIHSDARLKYEFDATLFASSGNVVFANFHAVRVLAKKINDKRDLQRFPDQAIKAGQLNAMGLIDEIYHYVLRFYEESANPGVFARAADHLQRSLGAKKIAALLQAFCSFFPPGDVYRKTVTLQEYLAGKTPEGKPNTEVVLEEIILLYFSNFNPAFAKFNELFHDAELREQTSYTIAIEELEKFFRMEKKFGPDDQYIFDLLRAPILASPYSLEGQLDFIKAKWGLILSEKFLKMILGADDLLREETKTAFHGGSDIQTVVPKYGRGESGGTGSPDYERFTSDREWMPNVVLIAKNTYVWLAQLSKKYRRPITTLNEIPDEELDQLARWNFTGLWLIGIWERSSASQKIKQMSGNPEAVASAYSVYDYEIANDLGGEGAFQNLRRRSWERGIRLAGDMVPNHMGIFSRWVIQHPDFFIQSSYSPFPNYRFTGPNLSDDGSVDLRIEDGYWSRTDAAVVFQRIDNRTGEVRYMYHGNDGTNMPWNDTAQLNFLRAEVREAVVQTIFHVARKFSVIRFDAAMTLAKKHFQRLWFPQPGSGGDIPSRADHAMEREEFDRVFPQEFWREVVDRINAEMPNTLLLAEAFWLLEGYFVRTLGMHRVYNSAFMHMIMKEENAKYRELIRNTLHYNPEILKRYVNFMSNPDEQTAIAQFGKDDKYFGAAVLMVTLPGLPMFAHGQVEGFHEKYGMEYKRAYHDETPDNDLVQRHEREIFPLLAKRHLFSHVANFEMYDFIDAGGHVNENVFAYSNKAGNERALVCYHNKYEETSGWIQVSSGKTISRTDDPQNIVVRKNLAEALELTARDKYYYAFRDLKSNLEYLRRGRELHEQGLFVELKAFQYSVFLDFRELYDERGDYERLAQRLQGRGVFSIDEALEDMRLGPLHDALRAMFEKERLAAFINILKNGEKAGKKEIPEFLLRHRRVVEQAMSVLHAPGKDEAAVEKFRKMLYLLMKVRKLLATDSDRNACIVLGWMIASSLDNSVAELEQLKLGKAFASVFKQSVQPEHESVEDVELIAILLRSGSMPGEEDTKHAISTMLLERDDVRRFLGLNEYRGTTYYKKEAFEDLAQWLVTLSAVRHLFEIDEKRQPAIDSIMTAASRLVIELKEISGRSEFMFEYLLRNLEGSQKKIEPNIT